MSTAIGWYPGHMVAARKNAAKTMAMVDVVIELVDARLPAASSNPMIESLRMHRQRPCLKVLNKADLADPSATASWLRAFGDQKLTKAVAISSKRPGEVARVPALAASLVPHRDGTLKAVRAMVMGIPNVGKSTLINALLARKAAKVGDEPGITKNQTRYQLPSGMDLIDTPGLMWPAIEHPSDGLMLAASHAIGTNAYLDEDVAAFLAGILLERYPGLLATRYDWAAMPSDAPAVIEAIATRRGYRTRGSVWDLERAARTLLDDFRSGTLGRISLETPATRAALLNQALITQLPE